MSPRGSIRPGLLLVLRRELRWMRRRPAMPIMTLVFPLLVFGVLAAIFNTGLPTDLPVAVLDQDRSPLSRQIIQTSMGGRILARNLARGAEFELLVPLSAG